MADRNFDIPTDRRMLLRIGVNLGHIIHDGTRTWRRDQCRRAARAARRARRHLHFRAFGKLGLPLRDIGEKSLKNIARPVHIYQIQPPDTRARHDWLRECLRQYRRLAPALGLIVLLAGCRSDRRVALLAA